MDSARPGNPPSFLTLKQAAQSLAVSVDVLISWNENNILKPTITPSGEVGYTQAQIDQLLAIRNNSKLLVRENFEINPNSFSQDSSMPFQEITPPSPINFQNQPANNFSQVNNYNFYANPNEQSKKNKTLFSIIGISFGFSILIIGIFGILLLQENKLNALSDKSKISANDSSKILAAQNYNLNETTNLSDSQNQKTNTNLKNEGQTFTQDKETVLNKAFKEDKNNSIQETYRDQIAMLRSILGKGNEDDLRSGIQPDTDVNTYAQTSNFDKSSDCPDCEENSDAESNVFDANGNIKVSKEESDKNKLLASNLAMGGLNQSENLITQNSSSVTLVSFLILGLIGFYFAYSKKNILFSAAFSGSTENLNPQPITKHQITLSTKLIEIHQKTDGTVTLFLQGKEFKISKPEMDSESDKFIERLLQLVGTDLKEIEYDSTLDDKLIVNTPLSKLVTRLGFVGIKRELFFPRTSKTQVHFRKYLTAEDLMTMNLTIHDITSGFDTVN